MTPDELRAQIKRLGMTHEDLAYELGINDRTIRRWIAGSTPIPKWLASWLNMYERLNLKIE
ncbi:MAG: helix-turn-helix domain-containing protein [Geminicoccaceae bacterium]